MPSPNEITVAQLSRLIGTPAAPVVIDVRIDEDFAEDPDLIPTAFRHPHRDIAALAPQLAGRRVVVYCQQGKKISQGAMALLRNHRVNAEALVGGHFAWRDAGEPLLPADSIPRQQASGRSVWVTRHRPKIDRVACPWLIRRFVDASAQFLFVAPAEVVGVAEKFDATPFDIEGVFWSHRGDHCTFDTMLEEFRLETDALLKLSSVVRGADTDRHELAPQSAGLLAVSLGLSRMYRDDLEQIEAGMLVYDAFYRWARDAGDETHDWPQPSTRV
ncbi:MAG: sulfurtransferase/chromate resistance protein [Gammaproteobacteria bacterium]|nr:sulfurtransferase/chromate resistance protein [Gammaproteobacteria bacterium]MDH3446941.1 sulfurtransferase/chromate resistance protein [Gammaproteobacteria bacterium]